MSAVIQDEYTGNGTKTNYNFTFPYLKTSDIKASLDAVVTTNFTLVNATTLQFNNGATPPVATAPADGVKIKIFRETGVDNLTATFYAGSAIKSEDLNDNFTQNLFSTQEVSQRYLSNLGGTMTGNIHLAKDVDITYEGDTENDFETRFTVVDPTADRTITFPNVTGTVVTTGDDGTVTSTMLTDNIALPGTFDVDGDTTLDNTTVDGVLDVNGSASIDNITFDGNQISTSTGTLTIDGTQGIHIRDLLTVHSATTVPTLTVGGNLFLTSGSATIDDIYIDGNEIRSPNGDMIIDPVNDLYLHGTFNVKPLGTDVRFSVDDTVITPDVNIIPNTDSTVDLGSSSKEFKDLYIDGTGYIDTVSADAITGSAVVVSGVSTADNKVYSAKRAGEIFYEKGTLDDITSGITWVSDDNKIATTAAIDARVVDLVDDVGGFVPIANETSFPNANPDVNNGAGTLVSVPLANNLTSNGSGVITIANGTVGNSTVTITGATASSTFTQGFGIIVETTSTLNTYTFHRYVPKATEVTTVASNVGNVNTVAGISGNVTTVAGISGNVTTVAGISGNVTTVANNNSNVTTVAGKATEIGRLGTADAVADMVLLGTTDAVADMNTLGTSSNVTNMNTLAGISGNITTVAGISSNVTTVANDGTDIGTVAGSISNVNNVGGSISNVNTVAGSIANVNTVAGNNTNVNTVAGISGNVTTVAGISSNVTTVAGNNSNVSTVAGSIGNVNTTAGSIANVNTTAGSIANVNTVATNITGVNNASTYLNNFLSLYLGTAASAPAVDALGNAVTEGDLYFNTGTKQLNIFNGSVFTNIVDTAIDFAKSATAAFNALYTASAGSNSIDLGGLAITGAAFSNEALATNRVSLTKGSATYNLGGI